MPTPQNDCLFCKIVARTIPSEVVYEDDHTFAFLDIQPTNPGHTLVIPKAHAKDVFEISPEDFGAVMETVRRIAPAVKAATQGEGVNIIMNNEPAAGQIIFHSHVHVIPRHAQDGFEHWHGTKYPSGEDRIMGEKIRAELNT